MLKIEKNSISRFIYRVYRDMIIKENALLIYDFPINKNGKTVLKETESLTETSWKRSLKKKINLLSKHEMEYIYSFDRNDEVFLEDSDKNIDLSTLIIKYLNKNEEEFNLIKEQIEVIESMNKRA